MKNLNTIQKLALFSLLAVSCSKNDNSSSHASGPKIEENTISFIVKEPTKPHGDLYAFNPKTNVTISETRLDNAENYSSFQIRDTAGNIKNLYITPNTTGKPSEFQVFFPEGTAWYSMNSDNPENIIDLMAILYPEDFFKYSPNDLVYRIGKNKKEIARSYPSMGENKFYSSTVQPFSPQSDENNFMSLLNQDSHFYVVTEGGPTSTGAKVFLLDQSQTSISTESPNSWSVEDKLRGAVCFGVDSSLRLTNNKVILACNEQGNNSPSLFLMDVSSSIPTATFLKLSNSNTHFHLGGVSLDKNSFLVTEENENQSTSNNPTVSKSYWLNITNPKLPILNDSNGAYDVSYNNTINSYVFSCILNSTNQCQKNTFGMAPAPQNKGFPTSPVVQAPYTGFDNTTGVHKIQFFKDLN